jgi:hypothetical protein
MQKSGCGEALLLPCKILQLKVSKSQKHFFLRLHCPQNERNIKTKFCPMKLRQNFSNISFVFGAMEFQEKMLLRFTDLYSTMQWGLNI